MSPAIIYLGLDVHQDSITVAVLPADAPAPTRVDRLPTDLLKRYVARLAGEGTLRLCYEASGAGFILHRALRAWGHHCDVIAPLLIPSPACSANMIGASPTNKTLQVEVIG